MASASPGVARAGAAAPSGREEGVGPRSRFWSLGPPPAACCALRSQGSPESASLPEARLEGAPSPALVSLVALAARAAEKLPGLRVSRPGSLAVREDGARGRQRRCGRAGTGGPRSLAEMPRSAGAQAAVERPSSRSPALLQRPRGPGASAPRRRPRKLRGARRPKSGGVPRAPGAGDGPGAPPGGLAMRRLLPGLPL